MQSAKWLYRSGAVWVVLATSVFWGAYQVVKPTQPEFTVRQKNMVSEFTHEVSEWARQLENHRRETVFLTLGGDDFGVISDPLRQIMWQSDRFQLQDYSLTEKFLKLIDWKRPTAASKMEAKERGEKRGSEYAIWGRINEFSDVGGSARLAVELNVIDVVSGENLAGREFEIAKRGRVSAPVPGEDERTSIGGVSFLTRVFFWLLAMMALPLVIYPLVKKILNRRSNAATLMLLVSLTLTALAVAYGFLIQDAGTWLAGFALLICFAISLTYNWYVLSMIKSALHN